MKKTQIATLKFLYGGSKYYYEITDELHKVFPEMKTGINSFNTGVMLDYLVKVNYIKKEKTYTYLTYCLTPKGKKYVFKLRCLGVNNDKQ